MADIPSSAIRYAGKTAFQHRNYTLYLCARILGLCAVEFQMTGVSWQVYHLTGDPLALGLIGFAQFAPFLLLFLVSGAVADRLPRARILGVCISLQTVCALLLFIFTATTTINFPVIFAVLVLIGVARAFQSPAQQAILPLLVPPELFANAVAWNSTATHCARIGGPALAGVLLILGQEYVYAAAIGCFAVAAFLTFRMRANTQVVRREPVSWSTLLAGCTFIWSRQVILGVIVLDFFAVLFGGATALLPIYAVDILHVGAVGFGSLRAVYMVGALACAILLTQYPLQHGAGRTLLGAVAIFGAAIVIFGLSRSFWLSLAALCIMGAADAISVFIRSNIVQIITPDHMRGRVSAVNAVFIGASNELGEFESGLTAAWWGVVPAVVVGGLGAIVVTLFSAWLVPQLRRIDSLEHDELIRKYR